MSVRVALSNILIGNGKDICRLCFKYIGTSKVNLNDEIALEKIEGTLDFYEILVTVLGVEIAHTISREDFICDSCRLSSVNSYKFIKMCKENSNTLYSLVNKLSNVVDSTTDENIECKSMFITLNTSDVPTNVYYNYKKVSATQLLQRAILSQLQELIEESQPKPEPEIDYQSDFQSDFQQDSDEDTTYKKTKYIIINKRKRKRDSNIVTEDIACDDDNKKCKTCLKTYTDTRHLRAHYLRAHAPKQCQCSMCPKKFFSNGLLRGHIAKCHTPTVCPHCGKKFNSKVYLKKHEVTHFSEAPKICPKCGKSYKTADTLRLHICQTEKVKLEKVFPCKFCGKKYGRQKSLRNHIAVEHKETPHICSLCGKKFPYPAALKDHMVVHTKEKKFPCETCGGRFVSRLSLLYHTRTHTGEKPYKCELCDKRFINTSRRMDHMRTNHLERKHQCDMCNSKFKCKLDLRRHIARHYNPKSQLYISKIT